MSDAEYYGTIAELLVAWVLMCVVAGAAGLTK